MSNDNILNIDDFVKQNMQEDFDDEILEPIKRYKIPRNDPCPCGSGKKFKKCCAKIQPDKPIEHYIEKLIPFTMNFKLLEFMDLNKYYKIAKKADSQYPVEPTISEIAGVISYTLGYFNDAEKYLSKYYNIVKDDISDDTLYYLIDTLNELDKYKKSEEILDKMIEIYEDVDLLILMTETKFALNKIKEGYKYANKTYKISGENIGVLNLNLKLFVKNRLYNKAFPIIKENYTELVQLEDPESVISLVHLMIETVFLLDESEIDNTKQYLRYLDKIIKIIQIVEPSKKLKKENVNKIRKLIDENYDVAFFLVRLFYTLENYEWITRNEDLLLEITELKDIMVDSILDANYQEKNYQYLLDNISKTYKERFKNATELVDVINIFNYYLNSLYELNEVNKTKQLIEFLYKRLEDNTLEIVISILSRNSPISTFEILNFIKNSDNYNVFNKQEILDVLLTLLVRNMNFVDTLEMPADRKSKVQTILDEYKKLNIDSFVYHYAMWLIYKIDNKEYKYSIKEILTQKCFNGISVELKYLVSFKFSKYEYILNNFTDKDLLREKSFDLYYKIAQFLNNEIKSLEVIFREFPNNVNFVFEILDQVLDYEKKQKIFDKYL